MKVREVLTILSILCYLRCQKERAYMSRVTPRVLKGFRDYLPEVMVPRERMLSIVASVFESFGFAPLATPALEYTEILTGKYGTEGDQLLYRFEDNGGRDVSLRYDLTVPLARVVGQHANLPRPFRRYQIAPVWRAEKPGRGRFREFMQCDVDIVGSDSLLADFECIQVGVALLRELGVHDFEMRINDRRVLDGLMSHLGIAGESSKQDVLRSIDKLPKIGWDKVKEELEGKLELDESGYTAIHTFLHGDLNEVDDTVVDMEIAAPGIDALNQLMSWAEAVGIREQLVIDLSIARGLDYYTSTIYESFLGALPGFGSVMSGGRYDGLMGLFSKQDVPAVGISLGVDRLLAGLIELDLIDSDETHTDVYVTVFNQETVEYAMQVASAFRSAGIRSQVHLEAGQKMGKQFKAASRTGAPFVVVAGPGEQSRQLVTVKDMESGEQIEIPVDQAVEFLLSKLEAE
jgi:histidyl-tRNA synthetase